MENTIVQNFWEYPFNIAINLKQLQSLLMESYVEVCTAKFKMHNNQNCNCNLFISEKKLTTNKFYIKSKCKYKHYKKVQIQVKHNIQKQED